MLPKTIEEQLASFEALVYGRRGHQLGSFVLFADFCVALRFNGSLLALNWEWAKSHLGVGGTIAIMFSFFIFAGVLIPWIQFLLTLPSLIGTEIIINKWTKKNQYLEGISNLQLLNFAICQGNGVAYQEYLRKELLVDDMSKDRSWSFVFLCSLGLDAFASRGGRETLLRVLWTTLRSLPAWIFLPSIIALAVSLLGLLLSSMLFFRFAGRAHLVYPMLYQKVRGTMFPPEGEST